MARRKGALATSSFQYYRLVMQFNQSERIKELQIQANKDIRQSKLDAKRVLKFKVSQLKEEFKM